jgi:Na+/proline symporter
LQLNFAGQTDNDEMREEISLLNHQEMQNRQTAREIIAKADSLVEVNDKDYVFIHFILNNLPRGLIGLLLAVILSAAMSSTASELNALAATTTMDLYRRNDRHQRNEMYYVSTTKWFTFGWGVLAILVASIADLFDNLIQLVNIIGSIFYGNILGIFLIAFFVKYVRGTAVFTGALVTQALVIMVFMMDVLPYLWLNLLGCALVMVISVCIQMLTKDK